jgi:hypothetical protein
MLGYGRERIHSVFSTIEGRNLFDDYIAGGRKAGVYTLDKKERPVKTADNLNYVETKSDALIVGGEDVTTRLALPEKIGGLPVKAVWGFRNENLVRIRVPDTVTYIRKEAFAGNPLSSVEIPDSVTFIGNRAFRSEQTTVSSVTLGANVMFGRDDNRLGFNFDFDIDPFGNDFVSFYNKNGKKAGTYTYTPTSFISGR